MVHMSEKRGFRIVDHTADVIVESWGESQAECLEELARGFCAVFVAPTAASERRRFRVDAPATDLAPMLLEEIIYLLDTSGSIPRGAEVSAIDSQRVEGWIELALPETAEIVGAAPKAISRTDAGLIAVDDRWTCRVTVDV
jgi:SHS2 domain-containing protein